MDQELPDISLQPGQRLARGVCRYLRSTGMAPITELVPVRGLRVDVMALAPSGEVWVVECKSSRADFMTDQKWQGYLPWCDRFFWAVDADFPTEILPPETGLILADDFGAEVQRMALETRLSAPRRKVVAGLFARTAALRLQFFTDPGVRALQGSASERLGARPSDGLGDI